MQMPEIGPPVPLHRHQVVVAFVCDTDAYFAQQRRIARPSFSDATHHLLGEWFERECCSLSTFNGDQHDTLATHDEMEYTGSKPSGRLAGPAL